MDHPGNTTIIQGLLDRLAADDESARVELIEHAQERLRRLAAKMLRQNPALQRWVETDDVLQDALMRLHRSLATERPESTRRFVGLAATQIRRELIDLWRHYYGTQRDQRRTRRHGARHATDFDKRMLKDEPSVKDTQASEISSEDMELFHAAVGQLPNEMREVFEKSFYLEMTQAEIANDLGVSTKTVKRRWRDARLRLSEALHEGGA